jgi:predicted O-methyltransferase YrrM
MKKHHFISLLNHSYKMLGGYNLPLLRKLEYTWELATLYSDVQHDTLLGLTKLSSLYRYLKMSAPIVGAIAELGVYKGGAAKLIATVVPDKKLYLFDTFEGMPNEQFIDKHKAGDFDDTSIEEVSHLLQGLTNIVFRKGYFPDTAKGLEAERFAFVHIDGDLYQSTLDALTFFYPRMTKGGIIVLDDYEWPHCPGVKQAIDEFFLGKPEKPFVRRQYQAVLVKE